MTDKMQKVVDKVNRQVSKRLVAKVAAEAWYANGVAESSKEFSPLKK